LPGIASLGNEPPAGDGNRLGRDGGPVITSKSESAKTERELERAMTNLLGLEAALPLATFA
jgi:hypothetical protein